MIEAMYITYETVQYAYGYKGRYANYSQPPKTIPRMLRKPEFMPTKLVRISDMTVVDGSQVNEGYCALSYSWNTSGKIIIDKCTGKYRRVDEGRHKIVCYDNVAPDKIIQYAEAYRDKLGFYSSKRPNGKLWKLYQVLQIMEDNDHYFLKPARYVKFEGIIQQICQQFNIKYLWYDQMCISQDDKEEKHHEIRNMHHIYSNAYCTVSLVPEFSNEVMLNENQQYFKRLWTLEEAIKSKRLLLIGRNIHLWGEDIDNGSGIHHLVRPLSKINVLQILHHAHQRTSTKDHDRVFALIHLFPDIIDKTDVDYSQPLVPLMLQFYGILAQKDISILLFEKPSHLYKSAIKKYTFLPSWTGVKGEHMLLNNVSTSFQNYSIIGDTMFATSEFVTNDQPIDNDFFIVRREDLPPPPSDDFNTKDYCLCIFVQIPGPRKIKRVELYWNGNCRIVSIDLRKLARFVEIKKENLHWCHKESNDYRMMTAEINLDTLTDDVADPSAEYVILTDVRFTAGDDDCYFPVIKRNLEEDYYEAIGCCKISKPEFFSDCKLPLKTFSIQ